MPVAHHPAASLETRTGSSARILRAAEEIFADEGAPGLSMRRLAERVGLSPAAIYKHFENKSAVIEALRDAFFAEFLILLQDLPDRDGDPLAHLRSGLETYVRLAVEKPHHYRAAFMLHATHDEEPSQGPEPGLPEESPRGMAYRYLSERLLAVSQALGETPDDLDVAAKSVWASVHGLAMLMIKLPHWPEIGRETMVERHVAIVVRGVFPKSA